MWCLMWWCHSERWLTGHFSCTQMLCEYKDELERTSLLVNVSTTPHPSSPFFYFHRLCSWVAMAAVGPSYFFLLCWLLRTASSAFPEEPGPLNFIPTEGLTPRFLAPTPFSSVAFLSPTTWCEVLGYSQMRMVMNEGGGYGEGLRSRWWLWRFHTKRVEAWGHAREWDWSRGRGSRIRDFPTHELRPLRDTAPRTLRLCGSVSALQSPA